MFAIWCAVVLTTLVTMVFGQFQPPAGFDHDMFMDSDEKYRLYWKYDQETITFEVRRLASMYLHVTVRVRSTERNERRLGL